MLHNLLLRAPQPLAAATDGFADGKKIGSGGFGRVYAAPADRLPLSVLPESAPLRLLRPPARPRP
eukprot:2609098-Prymnesium_polylepis.1